MATILSTAGVTLATLPLWKDAYKDPKSMPLMVYVGFTIVNSLATAGGATWSIEERFYPGVCVILCVVIVLLSARRFLPTEANQLQST